ncbi:MAG: MBL fold metallo-hydrolase [Solobacterium sp.]|nr:MBL fold metallo-hydrolase [Solobacterium sp.]
MKFALLASGSKGNCFVLEDEHLQIMIDCGTTKRYLTGCFNTLGINVSGMDAVLITHDHSDHISQLKMTESLPVYSPVPLGTRKIIPVIPEQRFQLQHMTVTPLAMSHDAPHTVGYVLETWQEKLVYITDTGYVRQAYLPLLKGADHIILESNHDVEMLMETSRPYYLKMRIASDSGHLSNEACADILDAIVTEKTKTIFLAHISQEANTREKALKTALARLKERHAGHLNPHLILSAAGQYEILKGGDWHETLGYGSCGCAPGLECASDRGSAGSD